MNAWTTRDLLPVARESVRIGRSRSTANRSTSPSTQASVHPASEPAEPVEELARR